MLNLWRYNLSFGFVALMGVLTGYAVLYAVPILTEKPALIAGLTAVAVYFLVMVMAPETALAILLLCRAFLDPVLESTRVDAAAQGMGLGALINLAIIVLTFFLWIRNRSGVIKKSFTVMWSLFLAVTFLSAFYSPETGRALRLWLNFVTYFCMFSLPFLVALTPEKRRFWWIILLVSFIAPVAVADIELLGGGYDAGAAAGMRIAGTFMHPNILAFYVGLGLVLVAYSLQQKSWGLSRIQRNFLKLLAVNLAVLLLMTKTRNAWLAFWTTFFIYGLWKDRRLALFLIFLPPLALLIPPVAERVFDLFQPEYLRAYHGDDSLSWRIHLWESSIPWIWKSPLIGHGLSSFIPLSVNFFESVSGVGAHSVFIELLFETGLIGLISYLGIFTVLLKKGFFQRNTAGVANDRATALAAVFVIGYLVINMADNLLHYLVFNWYFWFFVGLALVEEKLWHTEQPSPL